MNTVGIIMARLGLDTRDFKAGLAEAQGISGKFSAEFLGIPNLGALLGGAGAGAITRELLDSAKHVEYLSERFNVSAETIQHWGFAAEQAGSSLEAMTLGFNRLDVSSSKAMSGDEELLTHFNSLGISISDLRNLSPDDLMRKIGLSSMNAADMVAILGRNGTELRPVLQGIADGTLKFGAAVRDIDIHKLAQIADFFERAKQGAKVGGQEFLAGTITMMRTFATAAGQMTADLFTGNFKNLTLAGIARTMVESRLMVEAGQKAEGAKAKKPLAGDEEEATKLTAQVDKAHAMVDVLRLQLAGEEQIARALQTNADFQDKIADAKRKGLTALAQELELERELTLQKQAQEIAQKRLDQAKLSFSELGGMREGPDKTSNLNFGIYKAAQAQHEMDIAEMLRQKGFSSEARLHLDRAEEIKRNIPELRESEKERNSIDASQKIQDIATNVQTIATNQIQIVNE